MEETAIGVGESKELMPHVINLKLQRTMGEGCGGGEKEEEGGREVGKGRREREKGEEKNMKKLLSLGFPTVPRGSHKRNKWSFLFFSELEAKQKNKVMEKYRKW